MKPTSRRAAAATALAAATLSAAALTLAAVPADAASPQCTGSNIVMGYKNLQGALSHDGIVMEFRNRGSATCTFHGYPGFDATTSGGRALAHAARTYQGYYGGARDRTVPVVNLRPGHYASAIAEWESIPHGSARHCSYSAGFEFTPAGTFKTEYRSRKVSLCNLEVHPTAYGRAGQHG